MGQRRIVDADRQNLKRTLLGSNVENAICSHLRRGGHALKAVTVKLAMNLSTRSGHKTKLVEAGIHNSLLDIFATTLPMVLNVDCLRMRSLEENADNDDPDSVQAARSERTVQSGHVGFLVDGAGVLGQLAVDERVATQIHERFPVFDFLLVLANLVKPHSVEMAKVMFALGKFIRLSWRNRQRGGFHLVAKIVSLFSIPPGVDGNTSDPTVWISTVTRALDALIPLLEYDDNASIFQRQHGDVALHYLRDYCQRYESNSTKAMMRRLDKVQPILDAFVARDATKTRLGDARVATGREDWSLDELVII